MKKSKLFLLAFTVLGMFTGTAFASDSAMIGTVNLSACMSESKLGKKEQENLQAMQNQMISIIETTDKELREIAAKFDDPEYLDSLSPKAEEELKKKQGELSGDMSRYQNQFYQVMQQTQQQVYQKIIANITKASAKVAEQKELDYVLNRESCFYIHPDRDVTNIVISEMDKLFDLDTASKKVSGHTIDNDALNAIEDSLLNAAS
jgi:outer membrane protein